MVKLFGLSITAVSLILAQVSALDSYTVPSVDYTKLQEQSTTDKAIGSDASALLDALQKDGIVSLSNIPDYAEKREAYLKAAAECAVSAQANEADFLLHRTLQDGTKRYTVSTESGRKLKEAAQDTVDTCPGYLKAYQSFSQIVEDAVANVGSALDATGAFKISSEKLTARQLMEDSVHLDHFHAYEAAPKSSRRLEDSDLLSLEMHTDNGLMIAMSAPEYFDVSSDNQVTKKEGDGAGLIIKTQAGERVKPDLTSDELVLMLGEGINSWIHTSPELHPVEHGMQYPESVTYTDEGHKTLRAWFGKMILLNAKQEMANSGMSFGEYSRRTTRYLLASNADNDAFASVACPPHRHLKSSDDQCQVRKCTMKKGVTMDDMKHSCNIMCNHDNGEDDDKMKAQCKEQCDCEDATEDGQRCWMLCVADLDEDTCPLDAQECDLGSDLENIGVSCSSGGSSKLKSDMGGMHMSGSDMDHMHMSGSGMDHMQMNGDSSSEEKGSMSESSTGSASESGGSDSSAIAVASTALSAIAATFAMLFQ